MKDITIKAKWFAFNRFQMGRGFVAVDVTDHYDPMPVFVHDDSEADDEATQEQVEKDCADLARLLNKFRMSNDCVADKLASRIKRQD